MAFEKVRPQKVSAVVAEQIIAAIKQGDFPVGSKLPSENELAERMGVSRPTIREALAALTAVGLIESKPGSGNYVRNGTALIDTIGNEAVLVLENEDSCIEIMEARGLFEPPVAGLAAQKRTEADIENLKAVHARLQELAKEGDPDAYLDADKEFHLAVIAAAHNNLVSNVLVPLINTMDQKLYREFTSHYYFKDRMGLQEVAGLHDKILAAIIASDPDRAAAEMREHWERMQEVVSTR
ncbi:FadR family transcriptional regulator [Candidatus Bipolaricaulota bacterium]|jgi:DNA-binding FadR family transcriptional regulator|nr:FadR family transcriptional regulator [Candidatus Bipolaricaulota bacterium]